MVFTQLIVASTPTHGRLLSIFLKDSKKRLRQERKEGVATMLGRRGLSYRAFNAPSSFVSQKGFLGQTTPSLHSVCVNTFSRYSGSHSSGFHSSSSLQADISFLTKPRDRFHIVREDVLDMTNYEKVRQDVLALRRDLKSLRRIEVLFLNTPTVGTLLIHAR